MSDPFTTVVTAEPRYNLAVQEDGGLTLSLLGPAGPAGATGAAGAAGPNEITTSTDTALTGYIYGDGTNVAGATAGTPYSTASTLMLRDSDGSTAVEYLNIGTFTGGSPSGSYGTLDAITGSGTDGIELFGTPSVRMASASHTLSLSSSGIALTSGPITTSQPLSLTQTWSTTATYKAIDVNITDSGPANAASLLMDLRVGGISRFKVSKSGDAAAAQGMYCSFIARATAGYLDTRIDIGDFQNPCVVRYIGEATSFVSFGQGGIGNGIAGFSVKSDGGFAWTSTTSATATRDLVLLRDGSGTLAQRNGTAAQESRVYGTYTSATNFERLYLRYNTTTTTFQIGTDKGSGGGLARQLQFQTDATTRMAITSSGNVGIGNTSPASKLTITGGDAEITDSASGVILKSPDGTRYRITVANGGTLTVTALP